MDKQEYENIVTEIISNSGMARSDILLAIEETKKKNFKEADRLVKEADDYLLNAHKAQTLLLQQEVSGNAMPVTLLMVHAQDHLMTSITVKDLGLQLIEEIKARLNQ